MHEPVVKAEEILLVMIFSYVSGLVPAHLNSPRGGDPGNSNGYNVPKFSRHGEI